MTLRTTALCALATLLATGCSTKQRPTSPDQFPFYEIARVRTHGEPERVHFDGPRAYVADNQTGISVVDWSNRYAPVLIEDGWRDLDDLTLDVWGSLDDTLLLGCARNAKLAVFALHPADPLHPEYLTSWNEFSTVTAIAATHRNGRLILATTHHGTGGGVAFYTPDTVTYGVLNTVAVPLSTDAWAWGVDLDSMFCYVADGEAGLHIATIEDLNAVDWIALVASEGEAHDVTVQDGIAYVSCGYGGLMIVDVHDARVPVVLGRLRRDNETCRGAARPIGNRLYVSWGGGGLRVIDVSDLRNPVDLGQLTATYANSVRCVGADLVLCDRDNGLIRYAPR